MTTDPTSHTDHSNQRGGDSQSPDQRKTRNNGGRREDSRGRKGASRGRNKGRRFEKDSTERSGQRRRGESGERRHANRAGAKRKNAPVHAQRPGFRQERISKRAADPDLPADLDINDLDPLVLQDLKVLSKDNATAVAKHMLMAALLMEDDPQLALTHARAAKDRAGRISVVRETCGIAAYHAQEWGEALSELRAARRISGGFGLVAVMADCERGLGRPEKAIELAREVDQNRLDIETRIELAIVVAGARQDLGQTDSALLALETMRPDPTKQNLSWARLSYVYADTLLSAGRIDDAKTWFRHVLTQDVDRILDAQQRLEELE